MSLSTPLEAFLHWEKAHPDKVFLRQPINGKWHEFTYRQAGDQVRRIASALKGLSPNPTHVAILSKNCAHWIITDLAIMMSGNISVPIYPTLSADGIKQILEHSDAEIIFVGKLDDYEKQKSGIPGHFKKISFPFYGPNDGQTWDSIIKNNEPYKMVVLPAPDDTATIMYSSGTTGTPKGVLLSHGAFGYVGKKVAENLNIQKERFFSYLPLSHIAERALMEMVVLASGSQISFTESLDKFQENLQHEKPTIFGGVPRIYSKFQEGIWKKLPQPKLERLLSIPGVNFILKKVLRSKLGFSEAKVIVSGAAPTPVSLLHWFDRLGIQIGEIYGMTENTAYSHANYRKIKIGTVGQPWPGCEVRLGEDGEIMTRHPAIMKGYYKDPETTASVLTNDGFLKTGDKGEIDIEGFLTITGRVKDQFKTDKAKFIAPAKIELKLLSNADIEQACVVGMGLPQPVALVILSALAKNKSRENIIASLEASLKGINPNLESYERLEKIVIMKEPWSIENGLLTPSLKLKRTELEKIHVPKYKQWYQHPEVVLWEEEV